MAPPSRACSMGSRHRMLRRERPGRTPPQAQTPGASRREGPPEEQSGLLTAPVQPALSSLFAAPFPEAAAAATDAGAGAEDAKNPPAPATRELSAGSAAPPVATAVSARLVGMRSFIQPAGSHPAGALAGPDARSGGPWPEAAAAGNAPGADPIVGPQTSLPFARPDLAASRAGVDETRRRSRPFAGAGRRGRPGRAEAAGPRRRHETAERRRGHPRVAFGKDAEARREKWSASPVAARREGDRTGQARH